LKGTGHVPVRAIAFCTHSLLVPIGLSPANGLLWTASRPARLTVAPRLIVVKPGGCFAWTSCLHWAAEMRGHITYGPSQGVPFGLRTQPARYPTGYSLDLAVHVYTDPSLLDVAGALEALPELSLQDVSQAEFPLTTHGQAAERLAMRARKP